MVHERLVVDAHGRLTVPPQVHLAVAAPGFVALTNTHAGTLDPPRIHMLPASTISGRARDSASGSPLAGATVLAVDHLGRRDVAGRARSDAAGRFHITGCRAPTRAGRLRGGPQYPLPAHTTAPGGSPSVACWGC